MGRSIGWGVALGGALGTAETLLLSVVARYLIDYADIAVEAADTTLTSAELERYVLVTAVAGVVVLLGCLVALWVLRPRGLAGTTVAFIALGVVLGFAVLPWSVDTIAALAIGDLPV